MQTIIVGGKDKERGATLQVGYDESTIQKDAMENFSQQALRVMLQYGIGEKLLAFEQEQKNLLGGKFEILEMSIDN